MDRYLKDEPKLQSLQKLDTAWDLFTTPSVGLASSWKMDMDSLCLDEDPTDRHLDALSTSSASSAFSGISWESSVSVVVKKEPLDEDFDDLDLGCYDMELLRPQFRESKRLKRTPSDFNNNSHSCSSRNPVKVEARASRQPSSRKQARSAGSQSDSSSSGSSSCGHSRSQMLLQKKIKQEMLVVAQPKTENTTTSTTDLQMHSGSCSSSGGSSCDESNDNLPILTPPSSPESIRNAAASEAELALLGHQGLIRVSAVSGNVARSAVMRLSAIREPKCSTRSNGQRILTVNQGLPTAAAVTQRNASIPTSQASTSEWEFRL